MMKITMEKARITPTINSLMERFLGDKTLLGVSPKTIETYKGKFKGLRHYLDLDAPVDKISKADIAEMILNMKQGKRRNGEKVEPLKDVTINSYTTALKAFFSWSKEQGYSTLFIPIYKFEQEPKDVYTQEEVLKLMKKPNLQKCSFVEYRSWVIICFLLNSGCRAATLRNVKIKDLDFDSDMILFRHMKARNVQYVPMGNELKRILIEYLNIRGGKADDYLFPNRNNGQLTENALRLSIEDYNHGRGVSKTSIHLFRHYFAKAYVQNGGDCFRLQKILGHKKIEMTEHYVNLYSVDTKTGFEDLSPLAVLSAQNQKITMKR